MKLVIAWRCPRCNRMVSDVHDLAGGKPSTGPWCGCEGWQTYGRTGGPMDPIQVREVRL